MKGKSKSIVKQIKPIVKQIKPLIKPVCSNCGYSAFYQDINGQFIEVVCLRCGSVRSRFLNDDWF